MENYLIEESTREEAGFVNNELVKYNLSKVPLTQEKPFISINKVIRDSN